MNHIYHYLPSDPTQYTIETIANVVFKETNSVSDYEEVLKMFIFDALIGNHDRHGRNIALIETVKGKRLAPLYDNPSYLGLESGEILNAHFAPKSLIWTKHSKEPLMQECLFELERINAGHVVNIFYENVSIETIIESINASHSLSDLMKSALRRLIVDRFDALEEHVKNR